jgi:hypothetical protein
MRYIVVANAAPEGDMSHGVHAVQHEVQHRLEHERNITRQRAKFVLAGGCGQGAGAFAPHVWAQMHAGRS